MKHFFVAIVVFGLFVPSVMIAQETSQELVGCHLQVAGLRVIDVNTTFFQDFYLGEAIGLFQADWDRFDEVTASVTANQRLFLRGTADTTRWDNYPPEEWPRVNNEIADLRANELWQRAGQGEVCNSLTRQPYRGVYAYVVSYEADSTFSVTNTRVVTDNAYVDQEIEALRRELLGRIPRGYPLVSPGFFLEVNIGAASLLSRERGFWAPAAGLTVSHLKNGVRMEASLVGAWRTASDNEFGEGSQSLVSAEFVIYPRSALGLAFGARGAWETVRASDTFLERAYGIYAGPRLGFGRKLRLVLGVDVQYSLSSSFGREDSWKEWGISPGIWFRLGGF